MVTVSILLSTIFTVFLIVGLIKPDLSFFDKLPFFGDKSNGKKRLVVVGYFFIGMMISSGIIHLSEPDKEQQASPAIENVPPVKTIKTADDAVLVRCKNLYNKLMSFKDSPDFHFYGFGKGGDYHGWYMAAHNFTKEDDLHLMRTYGFVSGDILMLGREYVSSKGQETDYSRQKREELERIFSCKTWEVSE